MEQDKKPDRTELLLELIANELFRLRLEASVASDPDAQSLAERLDKAIVSLRKRLGMPGTPLDS
jgi:hypothetical protein